MSLPQTFHAPARRQARGAGLIEVLIAILVLAVGVLGIAATQLTALRTSQSAYERSQAVAQAYAILDAMRANRDQALIGRYDIPLTCAPPEPGDLVANDLRHWITSMQSDRVLGVSACGAIDCEGEDCTVTVQWNDERAGGVQEQQVLTETRL